jgi:AraC-like DNA-binding protein
VPHFHEDIEIMTVKEGNVMYVVNGRNVLLNEGDTIVVNSNQIHYSLTVDGTMAKYVIAVLHPGILSNSVAVDMQAVKPITENSELSYLRFRYINEHTEDIRNLVLALPDMRHDAFAVTKQFYQIWDIVRKQAASLGAREEVVSDPRMQSFKAMMHYIANNYSSQITLADIAASGNISKSLCNTLFHQYVGESPIGYLMHLRCRKVAELLRASRMPMSEIAAQTGFGGVSYMSETFRKFFDRSPREYRKQWE